MPINNIFKDKELSSYRISCYKGSSFYLATNYLSSLEYYLNTILVRHTSYINIPLIK